MEHSKRQYDLNQAKDIMRKQMNHSNNEKPPTPLPLPPTPAAKQTAASHKRRKGPAILESEYESWEAKG